ncbi:hypothetical protein JCM4814A_90930 [Streptomyces phaeofaciens JCM 4814]|uniref:Integral membrane protein n=1 Tax=Streptomyces phaeofaciens TaxID=68254 RepID=A0A918HCV5_9ACTN|nr:hypothetical protein [Streptomyces phaeofaciens]GGT51312.1 hypothetical protein GCM10010226_30600 [Streptomyces phaeofaciens]
MTVRGWCRTLRAGVFAAACVLLAALGHVIMSGTSVPWWAMSAGVAGTGVIGWLLAGRERGRTVIVTTVTAAQAVLHETFSLAQSLTPDAAADHTALSAGGPADMSTMDMGAMDMSSMAHGLGGVQHAHGTGGAPSFGMLAAHLLAAVLCGLWLAHGERAVFRILRAAAARLVAPLRLLLALPAPVHSSSTRRRRAEDSPAPARLLLCFSVTSRGPPVGPAVA